ncbi:hypothetical protein GZH49_25020 [Nocardia terpenica]
MSWLVGRPRGRISAGNGGHRGRPGRTAWSGSTRIRCTSCKTVTIWSLTASGRRARTRLRLVIMPGLASCGCTGLRAP